MIYFRDLELKILIWSNISCLLISNSFGAMRKNPTCGSKVHVSSSEKKYRYCDAKKIQQGKNLLIDRVMRHSENSHSCWLDNC